MKVIELKNKCDLSQVLNNKFSESQTSELPIVSDLDFNKNKIFMNIKDAHKLYVIVTYQIIEKILKKIQNNSMKITVIYLDKI
jgi:hypothetical protein